MSTVNTQRYQSGPVHELTGMKVEAGDTNHIGDLVGQSGNDYAKTFDNLSDSTSTFASLFLGVQQSGATLGSESDDTPCLIYDRGDFRYPLSAPADRDYAALSYVSASGSQTVDVYGASAAEAIGVLAQACKKGDTTVLVAIKHGIVQPQGA